MQAIAHSNISLLLTELLEIPINLLKKRVNSNIKFCFDFPFKRSSINYSASFSDNEFKISFRNKYLNANGKKLIFIFNLQHDATNREKITK